ncbi:hypothetical protein [Streptomyces xanthochromogenes]|uniref:ABC transporter permease n=1 Tax=Streptomyces xanthochromogenes TaxID=67384 RepID=A0ABQ3ATR0_9ACTN|nr:hypothetical protein [Streptomyces xanthochromogenes]GGY65682.1 hypothetical protein GCM10010326_70360 [Streptomyces xanthochromogenes]
MAELRQPAIGPATLSKGIGPVKLSPFAAQVIFLLLAVMSSALVAGVAGVLSYMSGTGIAGSVLYGGGAFILWMTLSVTILTALGLLGGVGNSGP